MCFSTLFRQAVHIRRDEAVVYPWFLQNVSVLLPNNGTYIWRLPRTEGVCVCVFPCRFLGTYSFVLHHRKHSDSCPKFSPISGDLYTYWSQSRYLLCRLHCCKSCSLVRHLRLKLPLRQKRRWVCSHFGSTFSYPNGVTQKCGWLPLLLQAYQQEQQEQQRQQQQWVGATTKHSLGIPCLLFLPKRDYSLVRMLLPLLPQPMGFQQEQQQQQQWAQQQQSFPKQQVSDRAFLLKGPMLQLWC